MRINLFWYDNPNLGDSLSPYIIEKLSGEKVIFKYPWSIPLFLGNLKSSLRALLIKKDRKLAAKLLSFSFNPVLFAVGSLLEHSNKNSICWGTGMAQPQMIPSGGRFIITRGLYSKAVLENNGFNIESEICGDPAILMPLLYNPQLSSIHGKIGVIPHVSEFEILKNCFPKFELIDFRTKDVERTIDQLLSCEFVYSSSLHGIILCHSYGIPCLRFEDKQLKGGNFKFFDHLSAVKIPEYSPLTVEQVRQEVRLGSIYENPNRNHIRQIQKELLKRAPFKLTFKYEEYD